MFHLVTILHKTSLGKFRKEQKLLVDQNSKYIGSLMLTEKNVEEKYQPLWILRNLDDENVPHY